jgi:hypothetical protein
VGRVDIVDDPVASGQGKVAAIVNPIGSTDGSNSSMVLPLGEFAIVDPFPLTTKQTFYFKLLRPLVDGSPGELNTTIGFMSSEEWGISSGVTPPVNTEEVFPSWGQYSSIVRYETDGIFDIRDGGAYYNISETAQDTNVWYEVWMVHDHADNSYQVYLKGGADYPEQTLVTVEVVIDENTTAFAGNKAAYRVQTFTPLDWLFIKPNGGSEAAPEGKDDTFIDDLYFDNSGENLTTPGDGGGSTPGNELVNISTRGLVGLVDEKMIGGFVISGETAGGSILIRGVGPTLGGFGVPNTVEDPVIQVFDGAGTLLFENDDWGDDADITAAGDAVGAFPLEAGSADAALLLTGVASGSYTVQLGTKGTEPQNGLLEVYKVE